MRALLLVSLLAACGTDPEAIDLAIPGTQVLVTEKVNGGAWKKLAGQFDGTANATTYSVEIGAEYELAVVCLRSGPRDAGQFVASEVFGTSEDPEITLGSWEPPNCLLSGSGGLDPVETPVKITGTFDEDMAVSIGRMAPALVTAGHLFAFTTAPGQHDLVAYSNTRLLIQRDLQLDADTMLTPVHVTNDGTSMLAVAVDLAGDPDEYAPSVYDFLSTRGGTHFSWWMDEDPHAALFVPASMLAPGDEQRFRVEFYSTSGGRWIEVADPTRLGEATLLPRIASSTNHPGAMGMTWSPISEFYTTATIAAEPADGSWQSVTASRLWLERHGPSALDFDLAVDGYDPGWSITGGFDLTLTRWSPGLISGTQSHQTEAM